MGGKNGKYLKQVPVKAGKRKWIIGVIAAIIFLAAAAATLWLWLNKGGLVPNDPEETQRQTETQDVETETTPDTTQGIEDATDENEGTIPQNTQTEPSESEATVVDAYLKEINGELHLIKVLSDGTEIDAGPVESTDEDAPAVTYAVTFMNYDRTVLKKETVKSGGNATPPAAPTRNGYTFIGWSGSYSNVNADVTVVAQYQENASEVTYYVVKFVDYDGTVLKTQSVEENQAATAPADPVRDGYQFTGWDKAFSKVTAELTVTAQYEELPSTDLTITVGNQTAAPGETVTVTVSLRNNPGIVGATLKLTYDESAMTLTALDKGSALGEMTFTRPGKLVNGCNLLWDAEFVTPEEATNGEIVILTFAISDTAAAGNYVVSLALVGEIIDNDLLPVVAILHDGVITVQ